MANNFREFWRHYRQFAKQGAPGYSFLGTLFFEPKKLLETEIRAARTAFLESHYALRFSVNLDTAEPKSGQIALLEPTARHETSSPGARDEASFNTILGSLSSKVDPEIKGDPAIMQMLLPGADFAYGVIVRLRGNAESWTAPDGINLDSKIGPMATIRIRSFDDLRALDQDSNVTSITRR